jgi:KaiC/GvpD/RAD55 family RecA-like ATPase
MNGRALEAADAQWRAQQGPGTAPGGAPGEPRGGAKPPRFPLVRLRNIRPKLKGRYLVKGLLPSGALTVVWGAPKCGKSFWTLDLAAHIACGLTYRGLKVRKGPVVYIAAEGAEGFEARARAWCARNLGEGEDPPLHVLSMRIDLVHQHQDFIADIVDQLGGEAPVVVVVDTLNRTYSGSESSDEDMTAYVGAADAIKAAFGCTVIIVHHCGLEANRPRGHTALAGAADAQISIRRSRNDLITAAVDFAKDMPDGYRNTSRLETIDIGSDEDGDMISTCIVVPSDETPEPARGRLPAAMTLALKALDKALITAGVTRCLPGMPDSVASVTTDLWRATFYQMSLLEAPEGNQAARQRAFRRAATDLQARELVGCATDHVWKVRGAN